MNSRFVPKIEKPCPASWDAMAGDEKRRFCEHCQLHVHNFSAMVEAEQKAVLTSGDQHICVSYVARPDAILLSPSKWLLLNRLFKPIKLAAAAAATIVSFVFSGCSTPPPPEKPSAQPQESYVQSRADAKRTGGVICPPPRPFWKRLFGLD